MVQIYFNAQFSSPSLDSWPVYPSFFFPLMYVLSVQKFEEKHYIFLNCCSKAKFQIKSNLKRARYMLAILNKRLVTPNQIMSSHVFQD